MHVRILVDLVVKSSATGWLFGAGRKTQRRGYRSGLPRLYKELVSAPKEGQPARQQLQTAKAQVRAAAPLCRISDRNEPERPV